MPSPLPKVVVTHWIHPEVEDFLRSFSEPVFNESRETLSPEELQERCRGAEGLMVFMPDSFQGDFLDRCPQLRIVAAALKGYDNFDVDACSRRGIYFTIVPDLLTVPTAELAVALTLGLTRKVLPGDKLVRSGRFAGWRPVLYGTGLENATIGLVGFGAVGRALAQRFQGFGCRLVASDRGEISREVLVENNVERLPLDALLEESDIVVVLLPLTEETRHHFDSTTLLRMKAGSYLVNVSRGSVVDEAAVADALSEGRLAGYAADVFEMEDWVLPDRPREISHRLLAMPERTLFTPHLGSAVDTVRKKIAMEAARQLKCALEGEIPPHALNADAISAISK